MKIAVDMDVAVAVGHIEDAVVLSHIAYWVDQNRQQGKNCKDGKYWTYNSIVNYQKVFKLWSVDTLKRIFKRLRDNGWLITGKYNEAGFDKTTWYTLSQAAEILMVQKCTIDSADLHQSLGQKCTIHGADLHQSLGQKCTMEGADLHQPIPNKTKINNKEKPKDNNKEIDAHDAPVDSEPKWSLKKEIEFFSQDQEIREALEAFMESRKKMRVPNTERAVKLLLKKLQDHPPDIQLAMLNKSIERGWKGLFELKERDFKELGYERETNPQAEMVNRVIARLEREEQEREAAGYDSKDSYGIFGGIP